MKIVKNFLNDKEDAVKPEEIWLYRIGKYSIIAIMFYFFFRMVIKHSLWCVLDGANYAFHEFGHVFFNFFGETLGFLGGTIMQLLIPFVLIFYFLVKKKFLSSSFSLFWFGENFLYISNYIASANPNELPAVDSTGRIHDWDFLLSIWGVINYHQTIADFVFYIGTVIIIFSITWAFFIKPRKIFKENYEY